MGLIYNSILYYTLFNISYYAFSYAMYLCDKNEIYEEENMIVNKDELYVVDNDMIVDEIDMYVLSHKNLELKKSQDTNYEECMNTYNKVLGTVMMNTFIYSIPIVLFGGYYDMYIGDDIFMIKKCLIDLFFGLFCIDPLFYICHKLLHTKYLYSLFHKKHHEITKPVGISALYSTGFEFYFGNILPIFLPLYLVRAHPITVKIWMLIVIINTVVFAHSGYKKLADFHDKHHEHFNKNYGTDIFVDKIMDTYM